MLFGVKRKSDELKKRDDGPIHITEAGLQRLRDHLARLKGALPDFISEAKRTAAYGDRSENAEYKEAKSTLRRTQRKILSIENQIKRAVIIPTGPSASGKVRLGSTVVLESNGTKKTFQILGPHETDPTKGRISHQSPLGAALIGRAKDDVVAIQTLKGRQEYRILEIR
jgi:transcription elongation factor GreA